MFVGPIFRLMIRTRVTVDLQNSYVLTEYNCPKLEPIQLTKSPIELRVNQQAMKKLLLPYTCAEFHCRVRILLLFYDIMDWPSQSLDFNLVKNTISGSELDILGSKIKVGKMLLFWDDLLMSLAASS